MELKLSIEHNLTVHIVLLIVPYGIETFFVIRKKNFQQLLIVPYGIETKSFVINLENLLDLLIVPYGIETLIGYSILWYYVPFNRTLWN